MKRTNILRAVVAAVALAALSCVSAGAAEKLVIISPHWEGIRNEFSTGFAKWQAATGGPEVKIEWLDQGGTSDDLRFIKSSFSKTPDGIGVDLFYGGGMDPYVELAADNLLEKYMPPADVLKRIPASLNGVPLYDAAGRWYGTSLAGFGILYNKKLLKMYRLDEPSDWSDLASMDLAGLVGSGDPRHSGSMHIMYEIILQAEGWEKGWKTLTAMGANARNFPKSSSQVTNDLSVGEVAVALSIDTYAFTAIEKEGGKKLGFSMPDVATVITPDPIAILKGAPNRKAAESFVRFCLSPEGQKIWMYKKGAPGGPKKDSLNKMSIMPDMYKGLKGKSNVTVNPFKMKKGFVYDFKKGSARWNLLNDLVGAFIIDTHADLEAAWKKAAKDKKLRTRILAAPMPEKQAMEFAAGKWDDPVFRNDTINKWLAEAKKRYKK